MWTGGPSRWRTDLSLRTRRERSCLCKKVTSSPSLENKHTFSPSLEAQPSPPMPRPVPFQPPSHPQTFQMMKSLSLLLRPLTWTRDKSLGELIGIAPLLQQMQHAVFLGSPDNHPTAASGTPRAASGTGRGWRDLKWVKRWFWVLGWLPSPL